MNAAARASGVKTLERERADDNLYNLEGLEGLDKVPPCTAVIGPSGRIYSSSTFGFLEVGHAPRRWAIKIVDWAPFDAFILVTILANCVTMAWNSPLDPPGTPKAHLIDVCEWVYLLIFTFEMLAKICAYGFIGHDGAYLRDAWGQLDFVVVSLAWLPILFPSFGNYSVMRSVRALRPLRALKRLPGMPVLVNSILAALPKLSDVTLLFGLLLAVCGIFGVEQFKGELHYRCAWPGFQETLGHPELREMLPLPDKYRLVHWLNDEQAAQGQRQLKSIGRRLNGNEADASASEESISPQQQRDFDTGVFCNPLESKIECPARETCSYFEDNINYGATNFDNFGWAIIQVFQTITFDGWTPTMYAVHNTTGQPLVLVYFLLLVVLGGFFIVNLFLAVLFQEFTEAQAGEKAIAEQAARAAASRQARRAQRDRQSPSPSSTPAAASSKTAAWARILSKKSSSVLGVSPSPSSNPAAASSKAAAWARILSKKSSSAIGVSQPPSPPYHEQQKPFSWADPDNEEEEKDRAYMALSPSARMDAGKVMVPDDDDDDDDERAEAGEASKGSGKATLPDDDDDDDDNERADDGCWPWCNCVPAPGSQRASLAVLMNGPLMSNASMGLVVFNMVLMCMPYE